MIRVNRPDMGRLAIPGHGMATRSPLDCPAIPQSCRRHIVADKVQRFFELLRLLPRYPRKASPQDLRSWLLQKGFQVTERTVQRDLQYLRQFFPLRCDDRNLPYGWGWMDQANIPLPTLDPPTALTFVLAQERLQRQLPPSVLSLLEPYRASAEAALNYNLRTWRDKVRVLSRGQPLQAPNIDADLLDTIYEALLQERQIRARYLPRNSHDARPYLIHPLGLVLRDQVGYLVCTLWEYDDPLQFALHRFQDAELLEQRRRIPEGFDLDAYIQSGAFDIVDGEPMQIELYLQPSMAFHLSETPLSDDQVIEMLDTQTYRLRATVANTLQLRWWLLGFGAQVEVREPATLRADMASRALALAALYQDA